MAPIPATTPAIQVSTHGDASVLTPTTIPVPTLAENQVLVQNAYAGVNFIDTYFRTGLYKAPLPLTPGREGSGTVVAVHPSVTSLAVGDKVVYTSNNNGYAGYTAVVASNALKLPDGVDEKLAAASLLQGLTALTFVREAAEAKPGQWALVHAAAGGTGSFLVQILKAVGVKVIGTGGTPEKCALATSYGADHVIRSREEDVPARVKEITGGHGVDVIFDGVGKATFDSDLEMIARKGTLIVFGNASGAVPPFDILRLGPKNVKVMRPVVTNYLTTREEFETYTTELFEFISSGKVKVAIHEVYPLAEAARAHTDLEGRATTGKLLLKID
ncbi:related to NADPH2:quinone reductase [Cephalotrichum gorgonifer]|uniref:Probable quinone oxidoreductase n=1 Tax=Cephalotrichum gorgonifer TaxID=2041049 RepID=A0AAE8MRB9_9PEZI|nr:related to NADPH2:quinone reductase [Cephalotrichum gorgonifer]